MKDILSTRSLFNTDKGFFGVVLTIVLLPIILLGILVHYGFTKLSFSHKNTKIEASKETRKLK